VIALEFGIFNGENICSGENTLGLVALSDQASCSTIVALAISL